MEQSEKMSMQKQNLKNLDENALKAWLKEHGEPAFRAKQINQWLYKKFAAEFADMRNIPNSLREKLDANFYCFSLKNLRSSQAKDQTSKFLHELHDGETIESVLIRAPKRDTVCISTQVGCPVHCTFCASGKDGLIRNLEPAEMIDQVIAASKFISKKISNLVVMGMGEPLLNLDNLIIALDQLCAEDGLNLAARSITISTSGIVPGIAKLADLKRQWHLAFSLHAIDDERRAKLIPPNHRYPLNEILNACHDYLKKTGRIVTLEYTLIAGKNDSHEEMLGVAKIAKDNKARVNIIPYNDTEKPFHAPKPQAVSQFLNRLLTQGVQASIRREKGAEIQAACGQLRRRDKTIKEDIQDELL